MMTLASFSSALRLARLGRDGKHIANVLLVPIVRVWHLAHVYELLWQMSPPSRYLIEVRFRR
ncbi:MAG: hypothetical protein ABW123_06145 [Cystobacter sp.]